MHCGASWGRQNMCGRVFLCKRIAQIISVRKEAYKDHVLWHLFPPRPPSFPPKARSFSFISFSFSPISLHSQNTDLCSNNLDPRLPSPSRCVNSNGTTVRRHLPEADTDVCPGNDGHEPFEGGVALDSIHEDRPVPEAPRLHLLRLQRLLDEHLSTCHLEHVQTKPRSAALARGGGRIVHDEQQYGACGECACKKKCGACDMKLRTRLHSALIATKHRCVNAPPQKSNRGV